MKFVPATILIIGSIWFIVILRKWRKSIKESFSPMENMQINRKKNRAGFLIDVFTLGLIGFVAALLYFRFVKN